LGDHGFGPFREKICVNQVLRQRGLQRLASFPSAWRHRAVRTAWKVRKWLHRRRQGGSTAGVRRPLEALAPVDWRRTAALAVHGELSALVYFNDADRFGRGPIGTPRQREQVQAEAVAAFREARHPITDEPLFEDVYATRDRFGCEPISRGWPDLVAIPAPGFHTRTKFGAGRRLLSADPTLTGTHRRDTALMIRAPSANANPNPHPEGSEEPRAMPHEPFSGDRTDAPAVAQMRDVAPTILGLLSLPVGKHMTGRCLLNGQMAVQSPGETRPGPGGIAIHQLRRPTTVPLGPGTARPGSRGMTEPDRRIVEDRLRDLGYLD
jgi:hypothetical protein